jgi:aldose 1-epimerase
MRRERCGTTRDGREVEQFILQNKNGVVVKCISYGCRLTGILLPVGAGRADILLGYDSLAEYEADDASQGAFVGRYANRIKNAEFTLSGRKYRLLKNDGANYLHGSLSGHVFAAKVAGENSVLFSDVSPAGEDGFPGELKTSVLYSLDDSNRFTMDIRAVTDADTHVNFVNHSYFDLSAGADETVENHVLRLDSRRILEISEDLCPTGRVLETPGTAFDFTAGKKIGRDIEADDVQLKLARGYDHCFLLDHARKELSMIAEATDPTGSVTLKALTTQPAVQLYTGNFLTGKDRGKGRVFNRRSGFCLETQHYPDSPNHPEFPSTLLRPGEEFHETTALEFHF